MKFHCMLVALFLLATPTIAETLDNACKNGNIRPLVDPTPPPLFGRSCQQNAVCLSEVENSGLKPIFHAAELVNCRSSAEDTAEQNRDSAIDPSENDIEFSLGYLIATRNLLKDRLPDHQPKINEACRPTQEAPVPTSTPKQLRDEFSYLPKRAEIEIADTTNTSKIDTKSAHNGEMRLLQAINLIFAGMKQ